MTKHIRAQIRDALKTALSGLPLTGDNVFASRIDNLGRSALPAIRIYTLRENVSREALGPAGERSRDIEVIIECVARIDDAALNDDLSDELDEIAKNVENAIDADPTLGGLVAALEMEASGFAPDLEGDEPVGVLTLTWRAAAMSRVGACETGTALKSGVFAACKVGGVAIARLRGFSIDVGAGPVDVRSSDSDWAEFLTASAPSWSAQIEMALDDGDAAQAALAINSEVSLAFYPRGEGVGMPSRTGSAIVSAIGETVTAEGDAVRQVRVTGNGALA